MSHIKNLNDCTPAEWDAASKAVNATVTRVIELSTKVDILEETTDWSHMPYKVPNHIYAVSQVTGKLLGYWRESDGKLILHKKPLSFTKSRRTFNKITHNAAKPYRESLVKGVEV